MTIVTTMRRFPKMVDTYMIRNTAERIFHSSGFFIIPRRMNSVTSLGFPIYYGLM